MNKKTIKMYMLQFVLSVAFIFISKIDINAAEIVESGEYADETTDISWTFDSEGTLTVNGTGNLRSDYIEISDPSAVKRLVATGKDLSISGKKKGLTYLPLGYDNIETVELGEGVISISNYLFGNCDKLNKVTMTKNLIAIGDGAFCDCDSLESIYIPGDTKIGSAAFSDCDNLRKVDFGGSNVEFLCGTFAGTPISEIKLPKGIKELGHGEPDSPQYGWDFMNCTSLISIEIPDSVTRIGYHEFCNCTNLKNIIIPASVTYIDKTAFCYHETEEIYNTTIMGEAGSYAESFAKENGLEFVALGEKYASDEDSSFYKDENGDVRCFDKYGRNVINEFKCDGTYTYYFQADGTAMKDRLTYHPDGIHVIYFDKDGHEVFSDFANVKKSISGDAVDDMCFFNVYGYMYVDTLTYDKTGTKLYYVNPYGVLERTGWFAFSGNEFDAGLGFSGRAGGYGYANSDCSLVTNTYTYDWDGNYVYIQGDGHMFH